MRRKGVVAAVAVAAVTLPVAGYRYVTGRGGRRLVHAPRTLPDEHELGPAIAVMPPIDVPNRATR